MWSPNVPFSLLTDNLSPDAIASLRRLRDMDNNELTQVALAFRLEESADFFCKVADEALSLFMAEIIFGNRDTDRGHR